VYVFGFTYLPGVPTVTPLPMPPELPTTEPVLPNGDGTTELITSDRPL
jgi:hypothetical protein